MAKYLEDGIDDDPDSDLTDTLAAKIEEDWRGETDAAAFQPENGRKVNPDRQTKPAKLREVFQPKEKRDAEVAAIAGELAGTVAEALAGQQGQLTLLSAEPSIVMDDNITSLKKQKVELDAFLSCLDDNIANEHKRITDNYAGHLQELDNRIERFEKVIAALREERRSWVSVMNTALAAHEERSEKTRYTAKIMLAAVQEALNVLEDGRKGKDDE